MAPTNQPRLTQEDVLTAIDVVRRDHGACTYRALADELGVSHSAARYRVLQLVDAGLVEIQAGRGGAIRRVEEDNRRGTAIGLKGTFTVQVEYDPTARKPLRAKIIDADGAAKKPD